MQDKHCIKVNHIRHAGSILNFCNVFLLQMVTFSVKNIETLKSKRYPASPFQKWFHPAVEEFKATNILNLLAQLAILYLFNHDNYLSKILSLHLNIRSQIARQLPPCVY